MVLSVLLPPFAGASSQNIRTQAAFHPLTPPYHCVVWALERVALWLACDDCAGEDAQDHERLEERHGHCVCAGVGIEQKRRGKRAAAIPARRARETQGHIAYPFIFF